MFVMLLFVFVMIGLINCEGVVMMVVYGVILILWIYILMFVMVVGMVVSVMVV